MKRNPSAVLACAGAVIGAGFASGREIVVFFTQYGRHAWWLIVLSTLVMTALCALCMQTARKERCCTNWCGLMQGRWLPELCSLLVMVITAGGMVSAAGHMVALMWPHPWAYGIGALGTLLAAWLMGFGSLKPLSVISAALTLALLCALMAVLARQPREMVVLESGRAGLQIAGAAAAAVGYASMNMTLAMGVVCSSAEYTQNIGVASGMFGWLIGMLLMIAQWVYSRNPESGESAFPMIVLLAEYGRKGYLFGVILLYLSVITTLASVLYALRSAAEERISRRDLRCLAVLGLPLAVSGLGFTEIVDRLYAPAGLLCLLVVFAPLTARAWKTTFS